MKGVRRPKWHHSEKGYNQGGASRALFIFLSRNCLKKPLSRGESQRGGARGREEAASGGEGEGADSEREIWASGVGWVRGERQRVEKLSLVPC